MKNEIIQKDFENGNFLELQKYFQDVKIFHKDKLEFIICIRDKKLINIDYKNIHLLTYQNTLLIYMIIKNKETSLFKFDTGFYIHLENHHLEINEDYLKIILKLTDDDIIKKKLTLAKKLITINYRIFCCRTLNSIKFKILYESSKIYSNNKLKAKYFDSFKEFYLLNLKEKLKQANFNRTKRLIMYEIFYHKLTLNKISYWKNILLFKKRKIFWKRVLFNKIKLKKKNRIDSRKKELTNGEVFHHSVFKIKCFNTISFLKRIIYYKNIRKYKNFMSDKVANYFIKNKYFKKLKSKYLNVKKIQSKLDHLYKSKCAFKLLIQLKNLLSNRNKAMIRYKRYNPTNYLFLWICLENYLPTSKIMKSLQMNKKKKHCLKHINTLYETCIITKIKTTFLNLKYFSQKQSIIKMSFSLLITKYFRLKNSIKIRKIKDIVISRNNFKKSIKLLYLKQFIIKIRTSYLRDKQLNQSKKLGNLVFKRNVFISFINQSRSCIFENINNKILSNVFEIKKLRFFYSLFIYNLYNKPTSILSPKNKSLSKRTFDFYRFKRKLSQKIGFIRLMLRTNERTQDRSNIKLYLNRHLAKTKDFFMKIKRIIKYKKFLNLSSKNILYRFLKKVNSIKMRQLYIRTLENNLDYKRKLKALAVIKNNRIKRITKRLNNEKNLENLNKLVWRFNVTKLMKIGIILYKMKLCDKCLVNLRKVDCFSKLKINLINRKISNLYLKHVKEIFAKKIVAHYRSKQKFDKNKEKFGIAVRKIYFNHMKKREIVENFCENKFRSIIKNYRIAHFLKRLKENAKSITKKKYFYISKFLNRFRKCKCNSNLINVIRKIRIKIYIKKIIKYKNQCKIKIDKKLFLNETSKKFYVKKYLKFFADNIKIFKFIRLLKIILLKFQKKKCFFNLFLMKNISIFKEKNIRYSISTIKDYLMKKKVIQLYNKLIDFYKKKKYLYYILKSFISHKALSFKNIKINNLIHYFSFYHFFKKIKKNKNDSIKFETLKKKFVFVCFFIKRHKSIKSHSPLLFKENSLLNTKYYFIVILKRIKFIKNIKKIVKTKKFNIRKKLFQVIKDNYLQSRYLKCFHLLEENFIINEKNEMINNFEHL